MKEKSNFSTRELIKKRLVWVHKKIYLRYFVQCLMENKKIVPLGNSKKSNSYNPTN
ncbi:hypothetical protein [Aquimarina hainanensis]|uniref:hypothetical protein n=1 Tax=Aquimarina hainanensis TaxID=1578017 RepID=UPI00360DEAF4